MSSPDRVASDYRLRAQRYRLLGELCADCGEIIFPPRDVCPRCRSTNTGSEIIKEGIQNPEVFHQLREEMERR